MNTLSIEDKRYIVKLHEYLIHKFGDPGSIITKYLLPYIPKIKLGLEEESEEIDVKSDEIKRMVLNGADPNLIIYKLRKTIGIPLSYANIYKCDNISFVIVQKDDYTLYDRYCLELNNIDLIVDYNNMSITNIFDNHMSDGLLDMDDLIRIVKFNNNDIVTEFNVPFVKNLSKLVNSKINYLQVVFPEDSASEELAGRNINFIIKTSKPLQNQYKICKNIFNIDKNNVKNIHFNIFNCADMTYYNKHFDQKNLEEIEPEQLKMFIYKDQFVINYKISKYLLNLVRNYEYYDFAIKNSYFVSLIFAD